MTKIDGNNRNLTCELFLIFKAPNTKDKGKRQQHEKTKQKQTVRVWEGTRAQAPSSAPTTQRTPAWHLLGTNFTLTELFLLMKMNSSL